MNIFKREFLKKILLSTFLSTLLTNEVYAQQCSINLNYGVIIDPSHIRILEQGQTQVQINGAEQLFIKGRELHLSLEQAELLKQFADGIRLHFPEIVSIAIEGADIGLKAVNEVIGGLTGENSASQQKFQAKFDELKWRIRARFNQSANNYYIAPQDFNDFDKMFADEFEQEIEEVIEESVGTILKVVGRSLLNEIENSEGSNNEERITSFDERMVGMSEGLELEVTERAKALDKKASLFCQQLVELNKIESKLHLSIEQLSNYNLIQENRT